MEEFKDIPGFEHEYAIATNGAVLSKLTDMILKPHINTHGYLTVRLSKDGKYHNKQVHILVAETYIPNPDNLPIVNHMDANKQNPDVSNLEWCTQQHNVQHAMDNKLWKHGKSIEVEQRDMSDGRVLNTFETLREASRQTNVDVATISKVLKGKRKSAGGYAWTTKEK